jgi:hypothetical protein
VHVRRCVGGWEVATDHSPNLTMTWQVTAAVSGAYATEAEADAFVDGWTAGWRADKDESGSDALVEAEQEVEVLTEEVNDCQQVIRELSARIEELERTVTHA